MAGHLRISLLGQPSFELGGRPLTTLTAIKARALLIYLAVTKQPHSRQKLAGLLWPDVLEESARSSLRVTLMRLRDSVRDYLVSGRESIGLDWQRPLWLDVDEFERASRQLQIQGPQHTEQDWQQLRQAVHLYQDDFLTDFHVPDASLYEEWVLQQREHYRRLALESLHRLALHTLQQGTLTEGISDARRMLSLDPLNETAYALLIQLYARNGQSTLALRQYEEWVRLLEAELGVAPSQETRELYEQIRQGKFSPPSAHKAPLAQPASQSAPTHAETMAQRAEDVRHNLPRQTTTFVGRQRELAQIHQQLLDPAVGLLTIVGLGGMGKTRLAMEAASRALDQFADGVWFVPLAPVERASLVASTIVNLLNLPGHSDSDPDSRLLSYLAGKAMLLVLDNFEHLLEGSDLISRILLSAPAVKLLVTSRVRLQLQEEWLLPLEGLEVPHLHDTVAFDPATHSAVELFIQRARRLQPDFVESDANLAHVVHICRLVGGMPLGIELAASWLRTIPLAEIANEVQSSLDFLASSLRNVPDKHRSMRAVFARSWQLLAEQEQQVLAILSLFRGGFTRNAAIKVAGASMAILANLVDSSWLQRASDGRYHLHELVRQYADEQLRTRAAHVHAAQRTHAAYFAALIEEQMADLGTQQQKSAIDLLTTEIDNIWAGWHWSVANLELETMVNYVVCLKWLADTKSLQREVVPEFEQAAAALRTLLADNKTPPLLQREVSFLLGLLLYNLAFMSARAGSVKQALLLAEESLKLLRADDLDRIDERHRRAYLDALMWMSFVARMGSELVLATERSRELIRLTEDHPQYATYAGFGVACLAVVAFDQGQFEEAKRLFHESMSYPTAANSSFLASHAPIILARLYYGQGLIEQASHQITEARRVMEKVGYWTVEADILEVEARIAMHRAEFDHAKQLLAKIGSLAEATSYVYARVLYLVGKARLARLLTAPSEAQQFYSEAVELTERIGRYRQYAEALVGLGYATLDQEEFEEARVHFYCALQVAWDRGFIPEVIGAVVGLACLKAQSGDWQEAARWLATAKSHPACRKETKDDIDKFVAQLNVAGLSNDGTFPLHANPESALEQIVVRLLAEEAARH